MLPSMLRDCLIGCALVATFCHPVLCTSECQLVKEVVLEQDSTRWLWVPEPDIYHPKAIGSSGLPDGPRPTGLKASEAGPAHYGHDSSDSEAHDTPAANFSDILTGSSNGRHYSLLDLTSQDKNTDSNQTPPSKPAGRAGSCIGSVTILPPSDGPSWPKATLTRSTSVQNVSHESSTAAPATSLTSGSQSKSSSRVTSNNEPISTSEVPKHLTESSTIKASSDLNSYVSADNLVSSSSISAHITTTSPILAATDLEPRPTSSSSPSSTSGAASTSTSTSTATASGPGSTSTSSVSPTSTSTSKSSDHQSSASSDAAESTPVSSVEATGSQTTTSGATIETTSVSGNQSSSIAEPINTTSSHHLATSSTLSTAHTESATTSSADISATSPHLASTTTSFLADVDTTSTTSTTSLHVTTSTTDGTTANSLSFTTTYTTTQATSSHTTSTTVNLESGATVTLDATISPTTCLKMPIPTSELVGIGMSMQGSDGNVQDFILYSTTEGEALPYVGMKVDGQDIVVDMSAPGSVGLHLPDGRAVTTTENGFDIYESDCSIVYSLSSSNLREALVPLQTALRKRQTRDQVHIKRAKVPFEYDFAVTNQCYDYYEKASPVVYVGSDEKCAMAQDATDPRFYSAFCEFTPLEDVVKNCQNTMQGVFDKIKGIAQPLLDLGGPEDEGASQALDELLQVLADPAVQTGLIALAAVALPAVGGTAAVVGAAFRVISIVAAAYPIIGMAGKALDTLAVGGEILCEKWNANGVAYPINVKFPALNTQYTTTVLNAAPASQLTGQLLRLVDVNVENCQLPGDILSNGGFDRLDGDHTVLTQFPWQDLPDDPDVSSHIYSSPSYITTPSECMWGHGCYALPAWFKYSGAWPSVPNDAMRSAVYQTFNGLTPGRQYKFQYFAKVLNMDKHTNNGCWIETFLGSAKGVVETRVEIPSWKRFTGVLVPNSSGKIDLLIRAACGQDPMVDTVKTGGVVWVDSVSLVPM